MDTEGHILTNYHVVHDASTVQVVLPNGETLDAKVAGRSPADDVALLKVDAEDVAGIEPLPLADSSAIEAGQMAIAVGSPFGSGQLRHRGSGQRRGAKPAGCP